MKLTSAAQHLRELVQSLSVSLDVPVELTDPRLHQVARSLPLYPMGQSDVVPVGVRHLGLTAETLASITEPVEISGHSQLGMPALLLIPLTTGQRSIGFIWITCVHGVFSQERKDCVKQIVDATVTALDSVGMFAEPRWVEEELGRAFVAADTETLESIIGERMVSGRFEHDNVFICLGICIPRSSDSESMRAADARLKFVTHRLVNVYPEKRVIAAVSASMSFVLFAPLSKDARPGWSAMQGTYVADGLFRSHAQGSDSPWLVSRSAVVKCRAGAAVWQARQAISFGMQTKMVQSIVAWETVSHLRGLALIPSEMLKEYFISDSLADLFMDVSAAPLVETLRAFLAHAGNVNQVAADLYLHRASVYRRIHLVEDRLGADLGSGNARMEVHLGLLAHEILQRRSEIGHNPGQRRSGVPLDDW